MVSDFENYGGFVYLKRDQWNGDNIKYYDIKKWTYYCSKKYYQKDWGVR